MFMASTIAFMRLGEWTGPREQRPDPADPGRFITGYTTPDPECIISWVKCKTLAGAPRGHPNNVILKYFAADENYLNADTLQRHEKDLTDTFQFLEEQGKIPTKSCTPDAATTLHGATIMERISLITSALSRSAHCGASF